MASYKLRKKRERLNIALSTAGGLIIGLAVVLTQYNVNPVACVFLAVLGAAMFVDSYKNIDVGGTT